jgi:hypothetical protein
VGREDQLSKVTWPPIRGRHLSYRRARHPFGLGNKEVGRMGRLDMTKAKGQERGPFTPGSDTWHFPTRSDAWGVRRHHTPSATSAPSLQWWAPYSGTWLSIWRPPPQAALQNIVVNSLKTVCGPIYCGGSFLFTANSARATRLPR